MLCTILIVDHSTRRSGSATASAKLGSNPRLERSAGPMTTPWPRRSTACTKTELIRPRKPWRTIEEVELATAEWVDWFDHRRLYENCSDVPPLELETAY